MKIPTNLNLRQTLEGMVLTFDSSAAEGLAATIQFDVTGPEPGIYHLRIADGECTFHPGPAAVPTLTISTPSDVWLQISSGQLSGQEALMQGLYTATGDLSLLLKMDSLFKPAEQTVLEAPSTQRPPGPLPLPGMAWLTIAFLPWIIHWITFDIPGLSHWISVGLPLLLSALIVGYRLAFDRPTWLEWGGLGFFGLAGILTLTGDGGFSVWGSVISGVVMGSLWLGTLLFCDTSTELSTSMPLSGNYSKWSYGKALWRNSMFIYPNAVISLMWGWQFILAALFGVAAILLPNLTVVFTTLRYLLLVPAFIFTSVYQKRATQLRVDDYDKTMGRLRFWAGMGLSAVSGLLLAATMPNFDVGLLGWLALVPLLMAVATAPIRQHYVLALPFGLIWSVAVHNWYPHIFPPTLGYFLIIAVGAFYAGIIQLGAWLQARLPGALKLLALPVTWAAVEYVKFIAPVVEDWWFVLLAKSQWRFPPALQILSVTGFPGLSFLIMLANVALAFLLLRNQVFRKKPGFWACAAALAIVAVVVGWGAISIPQSPADTFTIAVNTDMVNQDPAIQAAGEFDPNKKMKVGYIASTPQQSQAIFDVNADLTRSIANQRPTFVVWPENEFSDADDARFMDQLKDLAREMDAYIVADVVWRAPTGLHDTALMVGPEGNEVGRRAKINTTSGEEEVGFVPGPDEFPVFDTPYGKVGVGVCWDRHRLWVTRELARAGAQIILMPVDDDFDATPWFPAFHASDGVFRAVENRATFGLGTTNGLSLVVDPYGRIVAEGDINQRSVVIGETFTVPGQSLYTRWGDWFGWVMVAGVAVMVSVSILKRK